MKVHYTKAKKRIATVWFTYAAALFALILLQSLAGKFEEKGQEAWGWFLSLVMPNLTLMITVFIKDLNSGQLDNTNVDSFFLRLALGLSLCYLTSILVIILVQPMTGRPIITLMGESAIFLGPFQGLVSGSIGLFFVNKEKE